MGTPLFERLPRGLRLTAAGKVLVRHVRETLEGHERMLAQVASLRGLTRGEVTIATMASLAAGEAGLALAYRLPPNPRLRCIAAFEHRLGAVMAPGHPLSGRYHVRMAECLDYPLVAADRSMTLREVLDRPVPEGMTRRVRRSRVAAPSGQNRSGVRAADRGEAPSTRH